MPKVGGHVCARTLLLLCKYMIALLIRQSALIDAIVTRPFDPFQFEPPVRQGRADCAHGCAARLRRRLRSRSKTVHMHLGQHSCRSAVLAWCFASSNARDMSAALGRRLIIRRI